MIETRADKRRAACRRNQKKRVLRGICSNCPTPVTPGRWRCAACQEKTREYQRKLRADRKAAGLCPRCGSRAVAEHNVYCVDCLAAQKRRYQARKESA